MVCWIFGYLHTPSHPRWTVMLTKLTVYPCICVYIHIYIIHAWLYMFLKVSIENYWEWAQCLCSFTWDQRNFFSIFSNLIFYFLFLIFFLFFFSLQGLLNVYLLSPFRIYLETLSNVPSSSYWYANIFCNICKEL